MSIAGLVNVIILLILGVLLIIKSKSFAEACRINKVKAFGPAKYDDMSESVARFGITLIGVCFALGGLLQV
jgi:hypothetical protein